MQELINKVAANAGISNEQAQKSIETVSAYIKEKLPPVMHTQIDTIVGGGTLTDAFKKQMNEFADRADDVMKDFRNSAEEFTKKMQDRFKDTFGK